MSKRAVMENTDGSTSPSRITRSLRNREKDLTSPHVTDEVSSMDEERSLGDMPIGEEKRSRRLRSSSTVQSLTPTSSKARVRSQSNSTSSTQIVCGNHSDSQETVELDSENQFVGRMTRSRTRSRSTTPCRLLEKAPASSSRSCSRKTTLEVVAESLPSMNIPTEHVKKVVDEPIKTSNDFDIGTPAKMGNADMEGNATLFTPVKNIAEELPEVISPTAHRDESFMDWEQSTTPKSVNTPNRYLESKDESASVEDCQVASIVSQKSVPLVNSTLPSILKQATSSVSSEKKSEIDSCGVSNAIKLVNNPEICLEQQANVTQETSKNTADIVTDITCISDDKELVLDDSQITQLVNNPEICLEQQAIVIEETSTNTADIVTDIICLSDDEVVPCDAVSSLEHVMNPVKCISEQAISIINESAASALEQLDNQLIPTDEDAVLCAHQIGGMYADVGNFKNVFNNPSEVSADLLQSLKALYSFSTTIERRPDDICSVFINDSDETIWQQISYRNRQIGKEFKRYRSLLELKAELPGSIATTSDSEEIFDDFEQDILDDENLSETDILECGDDKEIRVVDSQPSNTRKYPRTPVDDKFFSLAEMNAFLDEQDRRSEQQDTFLDSVGDDSWGGQTSYRYEDFFGKLEDAIPATEGSRKSIKRKAPNVEENSKRKSVRFAIEDNKECVEDEAEQELILLGNEPESMRLETKLERNLSKLKDTIKKLEDENLQSRSWELSGEVSANDREENALLEKFVQFDHGAKKAPEITEDFTEKLESIILQRIEDKTFDDVMRKKKSEERTEAYRNNAIEEQEMMKKSLAEVYEQEYQKTAGQTEANDKSNDQHSVIEKRMRELFRLIDALSHFEYTPPEVRPEVRVVNNMSAVLTEEVGMMSSTDAQLLAPEEIKKRQKGELKTSDERDKTDKLRERRKKKNKQRSMVMVMGEQALAGQIEKKKKKKIAQGNPGQSNATTSTNLKSSNFFNQLQDTVRKEITEKTTKKKKVKSEKVENGGSKFKL